MREISRSQWREFLDQFSRLHHGQAAGIESASVDNMAWPHARGLPLLGVSAEGERIEIVAGEAGGAHVGHAVERPARVWAAEWNDGVSAVLEIESEDGSRTRVSVGPAEQTIPEGAILDGLYEPDMSGMRGGQECPPHRKEAPSP
ncbi:MAG TPA: DUF5335 family protein [Tepidisphaeraceae bacterium]|nr:DUF5335 family protein [Tepidisphaeraceae bacterium]